MSLFVFVSQCGLGLLGQEYQDIKTALSRYEYRDWVFHRLQTKMEYKLSIQHHNNNPNPHWDTNTNKDLEVSWYSLEQYIGCINRQAFNYYCSLFQVWGKLEL